MCNKCDEQVCVECGSVVPLGYNYCDECWQEREDNGQNEPEECDFCGGVYSHRSRCPNDDSPFANLIKDGYD